MRYHSLTGLIFVSSILPLKSVYSMRDTDSDQHSSRGPGSGGEDERRSRDGGPLLGRRTLSLQPKIWLTTLSTVVAVATGMFTLRDQIFPPEQGTATASVGQYQQSVGEICSALNEDDRARARDARRLKTRLARARGTLAQRNALLDAWNKVVARSEHELGRFKGFEVPRELKSRQRVTVAAWQRTIMRQRGYTQRLDAATSRRDLVEANRTLPAMRTSLDRDRITRAAALTRLGGPHCRLNGPIATPTTTLPGTDRSLSPPASSPSGKRLASIRKRQRPSRHPTRAQRAAGSNVSPDVSPPRGDASPDVSPNVNPSPDVNPEPTPNVAPPPASPPPSSSSSSSSQDSPPEHHPGP